VGELAGVRGVRPGVPFCRGAVAKPSFAGEYEVPFPLFDACILN